MSESLSDERPDVLSHCAQVFEELSQGQTLVSKEVVHKWAKATAATTPPKFLSQNLPENMDIVEFTKAMIAALKN